MESTPISNSMHHSKDQNMISIFKMIGHYFDRQVSWLDAGEPVSLSETSGAAEHRIEIKGVSVDASIETVPNQSFDVVSLLNLTSHVQNPVETLQEAVRVVKQEGLLLITTVDPIDLNHNEPKLRPPSYWVSLLQNLNLNVCLRFGEEEHQIELLAAPKESTAFHSLQSAFLSLVTQNNLTITSNHSGFHVVSRTSSKSKQDQQNFYALYMGDTAVRASVCIYSNEPQNPDVFLGDLKLRYEGSEKKEDVYQHRWRSVTVTPSGHSVLVKTNGQVMTFTKMEWNAEPVSREVFTQSLPFDHYQRYRIVADILKSLHQPLKTILDVGGAFGFLHQFYPDAEVIVLDRSFEDSPYSIRYDRNEFPFPDNRFDTVVCIDTLEHVPPEQRTAFLNEIYRVSIQTVIVACPFDGENIEEADSVVREFSTVQLGKSDRFLHEHEEYSLPDFEQTKNVFASKGFSVADFPNGYLPRWVLMQMAVFSLGVSPELHEAKTHLNTIYNQCYYPADNAEPAYRKVILATRSPLPDSVFQSLQQKLSAQESIKQDLNLAPALVALTTFGAVREKDAALASGAERVEKLLEHLQNLDSREQSDSQYRQTLLDHIQNVDDELIKQQEQIKKLNDHASNLSGLLEEKQKTIANLQDHIHHLDQSIKDHQSHAANLDENIRHVQAHNHNIEQLLKEKDTHITNMQTHAENLAAMLKEKDAHQANLTQHAAHLSANMQSLEQENQRLEHQLHISEWYFNTALPRLHQPDCSEDMMAAILQQKEDELSEMSESISRFWQGMKALCIEQAKEQQQLHAIRSSAGYKLLSFSGMIPSKRNPSSQ